MHQRQEPSAQQLALRREAASLIVRQPEPSTAELLLEDTVLLDRVLDRPLLLPVDPSGDRQDECAQWKAIR